MKDILDEESRKALINYRIQRAYETMKEAKLMIRETFYNAAVNRMYLKGIHVVLSMKKWKTFQKILKMNIFYMFVHTDIN